MGRLGSYLLTYRGLAICFALVGSLLIFVPPSIPESILQAFGEAIFPYTPPGAARVFLDVFHALGIEFYGGAVLTLAFGSIDERQEFERNRKRREEEDKLLLEISFLKRQIEELTSLVKAQQNKRNVDIGKPSNVKKWLRWLLHILSD